MIIDGIRFRDIAGQHGSSISAFVDFLERRLGVVVLFDRSMLPFGRGDLNEPLTLAKVLTERGIVRNLNPRIVRPGEIPLKTWGALCGAGRQQLVGGATLDDDAQALYAALAEGLERYLWLSSTDFFSSPFTGTVAEAQKKGPVIEPQRFASFSASERSHHPSRLIAEDSRFLWIRGTSLDADLPVLLPAQTVCGAPYAGFAAEPLIRQRTTIGVATWPTQAGARLAGALEIIEREAYMCMWLNQITPPRIDMKSLAQESPLMQRLLDTCARYRFRVHALAMPTDAPVHATCVVLEDLSGIAPRFTLGLNAHRSLTRTIEKACTEAIRARNLFFMDTDSFPLDREKPVNRIGHRERLQFWARPENAPILEFLLTGPEKVPAPKAWDGDDERAHLARVIDWCKRLSFAIASVSLGIARENPTRLFVESVVIPELQPTYLQEHMRQTGGTRIRTMPASLGYPVRTTPYTDTPHPFV